MNQRQEQHQAGTTTNRKTKIFRGPPNVHGQSNHIIRRERLERIIHQLLPDSHPLINSSMEFYRTTPTQLLSSSHEKPTTLVDGKIDSNFVELLKSTRQQLLEAAVVNDDDSGGGNSDKTQSTVPQQVKYGPFSLIFDYYGLYLPMPLDLGKKERNDFQRSIFQLKIPPIINSTNENPPKQTLHNLRFLNFLPLLNNQRFGGHVIDSYRNLLEGNYEQCLNCIEQLAISGNSTINQEDYLMYYLKSLCYFLIEDYVQALNYCEESISRMMMKNDDQDFLEKLKSSSGGSGAGASGVASIRLQPIMLYVWILYKMFEFSHAEMVLTMCTEQIFPFNAEAHFNMAQFLVGVHGRSASSEIVEKIGNHLKKSLELYMNMGIVVSKGLNQNHPNIKNTHLEYYPQNMYNSIFKYFNHYLHFLQIYNFINEGKNLISLFIHFANDILLLKFVIKDLKIENIEGNNSNSTQYHRYNEWKPIINHPIELAFMFVSAARFLAKLTTPEMKERARHLYKVASELELTSFKDFNSPEFCLAFHCKVCGCLEVFSITKEYKEFVKVLD